MSAALPSVAIPTIHGRKVSGGVAVYRDAGMTERVHFWPEWRGDCPSMLQRYVNIDRITHKLVWHK